MKTGKWAIWMSVLFAAVLMTMTYQCVYAGDIFSYYGIDRNAPPPPAEKPVYKSEEFEGLWKKYIEQRKTEHMTEYIGNRYREWQRGDKGQFHSRIRDYAKHIEASRPLYPNGTPWTDEQLAESNKTRYNASGKQQVQRRVEGWRSPLTVYDNEPGVYSSGFLGPLPNGDLNGPYCPEGFDCQYFYPIDPYARNFDLGRPQYETRGEALRRSRRLDTNYQP